MSLQKDIAVNQSVTLLCLPCAGASASPYLAWKRLLPAWIDVRPVELPGRGQRLGEPFVEEFAQLVAQLCEEHATAIRGRHAFFGHSMGALLALAMARRVRGSGALPPLALFVCASAAPSRRDPQRLLAISADDTTLTAELRHQGGTPDDIFASPELARMMLDTLRADFKVCASFSSPAHQAAPPAFPVHAFGGRTDRMPAADLEAWRDETTGTFTLDWFDGGHFFIRQHAPAVLAQIAHTLATAGVEESHDALAASA